MKIFEITPTLNAGGAEKNVVFWANALKEHGLDSTIVTLYGEGKLKSQVSDSVAIKGFQIPALAKFLYYWLDRFGFLFKRIARKLGIKEETKVQAEEDFVLNPHPLWYIYELSQALKVFLYVLRNKPKLVHIHTEHCKFSVIAAKIAGSKVIYTHHNLPDNLMIDREKKLLIFCLKFADRVTAVSSASRDQLQKLGVSPEKLRVIPVAVGIPKQQIRLNRKSGNFTIGAASNLTPIKGTKYLIEAIKLLKDRGIAANLLVLGDGPNRDKLLKLAEDLQVSNQIKFLGSYLQFDKKHQKLLSTIDVFMMPSLTESLPTVLIEAMIFKKPLVASNVGGIVDLISHGENGLLVKPKSAEDIANALEWCKNNEALLEDMGNKGYSKYLDNYTETKVIDLFNRMVEELNNSTPSRGVFLSAKKQN